MLHRAPFGLLVAGCSGILLSSFYSVYPLVVQDIFGDLETTGRYLAISMLLAILPLTVLARHADIRGRPSAALWTAAPMLLGVLVLTLRAVPVLMWTAGFLYSSLVFCIYGLGASDTNDRVGSAARGAAASALMLVFSLGGCIGPILLGAALWRWGRAGYFTACAAVLTVVLMAAAWTRLQRQGIEARQYN